MTTKVALCVSAHSTLSIYFMTSGLQGAVEAVQLSNYASLTILTAVSYDYVLTFASEIEYIWQNRWTRVSTLFFLARYFGLCSVMFLTLVSSSFLLVPAKMYVPIPPLTPTNNDENSYSPDSCRALIHCGPFAFWIMIAAADLVMILRVWVLYNQSRSILLVLLPLYAMEVIGALVGCFFLRSQVNPANAALHTSLCKLKPVSLVLPKVVDSVQLNVLGDKSSPIWQLHEPSHERWLVLLSCHLNVCIDQLAQLC